MILVQRRGRLFDAIIRALKRARRAGRRRRPAAHRRRARGQRPPRRAARRRDPAATTSRSPPCCAARSAASASASSSSSRTAAPGSLWPALRDEPAGALARGRGRSLDDLLAQADYLRPFELLPASSSATTAAARLVARLGPEAEDGIDALLDQALAYESVEPPSLTGFLAWIDRDEVTVKRRSEEGADQVRVMTVHGAKGLEAPIVILPDTAVAPGRRATRRRSCASPTASRPGGCRADDAPAGARRRRGGAAATWSAAENRRLLYVGADPARKTWLDRLRRRRRAEAPSGESWHGLVARGDGRRSAPRREPGPDGDILALDAQLERRARRRRAAPRPPAAAAARLDPPPGRRGRRRRRAPLSPSGLGGAHVLPGEATGALDEAAAKARGAAVHRLLEHLHGRPPADRAGARRPAAARRRPTSPALLAEAAARPRRPRPRLRSSAPARLAEVDVAAPLAGARRRAASSAASTGWSSAPDRVLAVDFKSHRAVPAAPEAVPEGILRQMGAYRAALARDLARPAGRDRDPLDPRRAADAAAGRRWSPRRLPAPGRP